MPRLHRKEHFSLLVFPRGLTHDFLAKQDTLSRLFLIGQRPQYPVRELGLQRTARWEHYRGDTVTTNGDHVGPLSYQPPNIGALYSQRRNRHWNSRDVHKRGLQAIRRQLEDRDSESLAWSFSGTLPQSFSIFILPTPRLPWHGNHLRDCRCLDGSIAPPRLCTFIIPSTLVFTSLQNVDIPSLN